MFFIAFLIYGEFKDMHKLIFFSSTHNDNAYQFVTTAVQCIHS
jgi:hypothetical protein